MAHSSRKSGGRQSRRVASPARTDVEALVGALKNLVAGGLQPGTIGIVDG